MRLRTLLTAVFALCVGGSVLAQTATTKPAKVRDPLASPYYALLVKELSLSQEKQDGLRKAVSAKADALAAWDKDKGLQLAELQKKLAEARKSHNKEEAAKLQAEIKPLTEERTKLAEAEQGKVDAFFTAEQKPVVAGVEMFTAACNKFSKAKPAPEQKVKMMDLAKECGKGMVAAKDKAEADKLRSDYYTKILETVLSAEQREALKAKPANKTLETQPAKMVDVNAPK